MQRLSRTSAVLAAVALVAACAESPLAPAAHAAETPADATGDGSVAYDASRARTIAVAGCTGGTIFLSADEKATLDLHNAQRQSSGLPGFCVDATLTTAARAHSDDMLARDYFSHSSPDGTTFGVRLADFGYAPYTALAENIAWGSGSIGTPAQTFINWMNSAGHRANIENGALREVGIGVSAGTYQGFSGARVYTVDFGAH